MTMKRSFSVRASSATALALLGAASIAYSAEPARGQHTANAAPQATAASGVAAPRPSPQPSPDRGRTVRAPDQRIDSAPQSTVVRRDPPAAYQFTQAPPRSLW
jgi:hypothetical protein